MTVLHTHKMGRHCHGARKWEKPIFSMGSIFAIFHFLGLQFPIKVPPVIDKGNKIRQFSPCTPGKANNLGSPPMVHLHRTCQGLASGGGGWLPGLGWRLKMTTKEVHFIEKNQLGPPRSAQIATAPHTLMHAGVVPLQG